MKGVISFRYIQLFFSGAEEFIMVTSGFRVTFYPGKHTEHAPMEVKCFHRGVDVIYIANQQCSLHLQILSNPERYELKSHI